MRLGMVRGLIHRLSTPQSGPLKFLRSPALDNSIPPLCGSMVIVEAMSLSMVTLEAASGVIAPPTCTFGQGATVRSLAAPRVDLDLAVGGLELGPGGSADLDLALAGVRIITALGMCGPPKSRM